MHVAALVGPGNEVTLIGARFWVIELHCLVGIV